MKRTLLALSLAALLPGIASADNVGGCGWGAKLFDGQKGIAPQVLAVTTNGTSGNQTFGISSGTSGCTQDGVVKSTWKTAAYVGVNMNKIALDMSRGHGESLDSLAQLLEVKPGDRQEFDSVLKDNFSKIFPSSEVTSEQVLSSLKTVLSENDALSGYAAKV